MAAVPRPATRRPSVRVALLALALAPLAPLTAQDSTAAGGEGGGGRGAARRAAREALFGDTTPLALAIRFDHKLLFKDRDTLSQRVYDGRVVLRSGTREDTIPVRLRPRGHFRLSSDHCDFTPLQVEFRDRPTRGTVFEGQGKLKLVTHCRTGDKAYDEYLLREYLVYRAHHLLTPHSFRARLVQAAYDDSLDPRWQVARRAVLLEDEDDVARRVPGKISSQGGAVWENLDSAAVGLYALFQYYIGGTDWSLSALHNVRLVQREDGVFFPLAYDFDWTGLAQTPYAVPDPRLRVSNTRDRLFRGPCWPVAQYAPAVATFTAQRGALLALLDTPGLSDDYRKSTTRWIEEFFRTIGDPKAFEKAIKRGCDLGT
jgi:hypothetical protein